MGTKKKIPFRDGNRALDYLRAHYQPMDSKLVFLVESLTTIADELYHDSQAAARSLLRTNTRNPLIRIVRGVVMLSGSLTPRGITLTNCIFDLALTSYFNEVFQYIQDKKVASVLVEPIA